MPSRHAELLCGLNRARPAVVKADPACGDWIVPGRGVAQGDLASPLAAVLFAAAHAAVVHSELPEVSLYTFIDDRTPCSCSCGDMQQAVFLLTELDHLSGQAEDPFKEEMACIHPSEDMLRQFPRARSDYLDLLGIRLSCNDNAHSISPKAAARRAEVFTRLERLRRVGGGLQFGGTALHRVVVGITSLLRFDAAWIHASFQEVFQMATKIEMTAQSRKRYDSWPHRGAAWIVMRQGWHIEPVAIHIFGRDICG